MKKITLTDPVTGETREVPVVEGGVRVDRPEPVDRQRPNWLKAPLPTGGTYARLKGLVQELELHTVCQEARCPNVGECWVHGTATIMILGKVCTRACKFCAVSTGNPAGWVDSREPGHVARAVAELGLGYVVLTSVDRDDLPDGGAGQFAAVIRAIKERSPGVRVEALTPDFQGDTAAVRTVLESGLDVFAHNLETVRRLTPRVRDPRAGYDQSLAVLDYAGRYLRERGLEVLTKSSLMVGLGETDEEIAEAMDDLRAAGVSLLTIGQYLRPTRHHLPVERYVTPEEFEAYRRLGLEKGFVEVFSGPLVRSSYRAERVFKEAQGG
ncbi:lipoyl synthase [Oceanithermus desulfurans]|uniref:Lipoyl synthase n=2 Tax=Oceanithermus desulfurans TaxID=227924 RepID=A0A511RGB2_9DEIN|nr:lipoyl synthase [Oceanithermus desulfurans]MBB6030132.1 lipoic acid synthetase [Oceanithermus desulfurans]GEM88690.1 lipoyl synthase [Oceanithermus desulfurans NBRC 100063]